ncbi:ribosome silencing factor [Natroniella sulfidigena]|uniref:ribosome silencing factor n=1 Tax=Natroniella sulfidigena TaxID=723921 RepID=UPI00200AB002|nr:ribosome silencing factor [Natroniella sulfidigena]MCK8815900.1 ribosome silencing factor [Natroniella sulfidigena]
MERDVEKVAKEIAKAADDKKAEDIRILNVKGISILADYFIICSGTSDTQVQAIANSIEHILEEQEIYVKNKEGIDIGNWVVLDYADVIVHVFHQEQREYYKLEKLWGDAKELEWQA